MSKGEKNEQNVLYKILTAICAITYEEDVKVISNYVAYLSSQKQAKYLEILEDHYDQKISFKKLQYEIVQTLICDGIDVNKDIQLSHDNNIINVKPLYIITMLRKDAELTELMLKNGADITATGKSLPLIFELVKSIDITNNIIRKTKLLAVFNAIIKSDKFDIYKTQFMIEQEIVNNENHNSYDVALRASLFQILIALKNSDMIKILFDHNKIDLSREIFGYDLTSYVNVSLMHDTDGKLDEITNLFNNFATSEAQRLFKEFHEEVKTPFETFVTLNSSILLGKDEVTDIWEQD